MKLIERLIRSRRFVVLPLLFLCGFLFTAPPSKASAAYPTAEMRAAECTISGNYVSQDQSLCQGQAAARITGSVPAGGNGVFSYRWESSTTGATSGFVVAAGVNDAQHYQPVNLAQTTWFRRVVNSEACVSVSEAVRVAILPAVAVTIEASGTTALCTWDAVDLTATVTAPATVVTYQWLRNKEVIAGAVQARYMATAAGSYQVTVNDNGCAAVSETIEVTMTARPAVSIEVDGPTRICPGTTPTLRAKVPTTATGLTYQWLRDKKPLPGATQPTLVAPGAGLYHLEVYSGGCASGAEPVQLTFIDFPAAPGPIAGSGLVCAGEAVTYTIPAYKAGLRYVWSVPDGYQLAQGQGTGTISVTAGTRGGLIKVTAYNECDSMSVSELPVAVDPACVPLGIRKEAASAALVLYPNPAAAVLNLQLQLPEKTTCTLVVSDVTGRTVYSRAYGSAAGMLSEQIDVKALPHGLYQVKVTTETTIFTKRFIKE